MDAIISHSPPLRGTLTVPPDKAIAHRAVLVASLANGVTEIAPWPTAEDCQRTMALVQSVGVPVATSPTGIRVEGRGLHGLQAPSHALDCGESGTTLRLAAGVLAGQPFRSQLTASSSLSCRPMQRIIEPLSQMGARIAGAPSTVMPGELCPPLIIDGTRPLRAIRYEMRVASAQVKSAILLAGLYADGRTTVVESSQTRDHTERLLEAFGLCVRYEHCEVSLKSGLLTSPGSLRLPGDVSSAAFFIVAALCVPGSRLMLSDVGQNPTRTGFLAVLKRMGARVTVTGRDSGWEPRSALNVEASPLQATRVELTEVASVIDELPILMVAAACAQGVSQFHGVGELRVKETDRITSMVNGLQRLGACVRIPQSDCVEIEGGHLVGAGVESMGDHRTAMSLAVAGLVAQGLTTVRGIECVAKSFPTFFESLRQISSSPTVKTVDKG